MDESRVENLARASSENGTATVIGLNWARNVVQVSAAVSGEERCVTRQITAAWETSGEERCVTRQITAAWETRLQWVKYHLQSIVCTITNPFATKM